MIGNYVTWHGQLARIEEEQFGYAVISVNRRKKQKRTYEVALSTLEALKLRIVKHELLKHIDDSYNGSTADFESAYVCSNHTSSST